jgi:glycosyltransferase involved in cell wall biosynthesis
MAVRLHCIYTRYPHWGAYSGIIQFLKHINPVEYKVSTHLINDSDEDFPVKNRALRGYLRRVVQRRGMQWYKLSDLTAEISALRECLRNRADIIHFIDAEHSAQYLPRLLGSLGRRRVKIVATYHQPANLLDSLVIKDVISRLDCVTLVSPDQVTFFKSFLPADRIRVILHGIDTGYFKPGMRPACKKKFTCITVGHYLRDYAAMGETASRLQNRGDIEFSVVTSKETGLERLPNVTIHKNVTDARLLELYQQADLLYLPLLDATANNAILEGIACGLPVISTLLPSAKVYLPGEEAILVENNDPDQLTAAVLQLVENPGRLACMASHARRRAEELSWHNIAPEYEAVYSKLADES